MKNLIFFATLLIFILNISYNVVGSANDKLPDPVLDVDGNKLLTGNTYYVLSVFRPGGGVSIYPTVNKNCTSAIAVTQLPILGDGLPVTFANGGTNLGEVVRESTDIVIAFSIRMFLFPAVWKVDEYDDAANQYFVTVGDFDGNQTSINNWFQIRKGTLSANDYRFVFCPKVCEFCAQICTNVGIYIEDHGVRRFALGDGNFPSSTFRFKKFEP